MSFLQMSVSAGVLVIAIVLIRTVALNRLPKKMFLVLWGVALFRLLVPVSIPLPFSVPSVLISVGEVTRTVLPGNPAPPVGDNPIGANETIIGTPGVAGEITETAQGLIFNIAPTTAIWFAGMLAAFIFFAVIHYRNQRRLRFATAIRDNDFLNEWLAEHRLLRSIAIMQSDRIISPLADGIFKPRIILPKSMNMSDKQLLDYVLTHEYYHIKRYDALWKMVLLFALCVHWFNPFVWVMFVLASRDLELTCDEAVLRHFGTESKKDYAKILIGMVEQGGRFAPLYNGFSKNATQERIESIMKSKKTTLIGLLLALVLVAGLTTGALAVSAAAQPKDAITAVDSQKANTPQVSDNSQKANTPQVVDDGQKANSAPLVDNSQKASNASTSTEPKNTSEVALPKDNREFNPDSQEAKDSLTAMKANIKGNVDRYVSENIISRDKGDKMYEYIVSNLYTRLSADEAKLSTYERLVKAGILTQSEATACQASDKKFTK